MPQSDPSLAASLAQSVEPVSVKQVLHTTSLLKVERIIEGMRTAVQAGAFPSPPSEGRGAPPLGCWLLGR